MIGRRPTLTQEDAETIGIQAIGFLAEQPELLRRFLALAGIDVPELRARAGDPALLGAVLDFILYDESLATGFADAVGVERAVPRLARRMLPGAPVE